MVNPGVVNLADLNHIENMKFPYRFCVEDNIGESIHIHYKDIRLDLTVEEFSALAQQMAEVIDGIVQADGFCSKDFDPVFLVGISPALADLEKVEKREVFLEDILVGTKDENGKTAYKDIRHSRVFKALCGLSHENDAHSVQFNFFQKGTVTKLSNKERIQWQLERIKEKGYPADGELITLTKENKIIDGQHRAACLYFQNGNIKIPVRTLVFKNSENTSNLQADAWKELEKEIKMRTEELIRKSMLYAADLSFTSRTVSFSLKDKALLTTFIHIPRDAIITAVLFRAFTWRNDYGDAQIKISVFPEDSEQALIEASYPLNSIADNEVTAVSINAELLRQGKYKVTFKADTDLEKEFNLAADPQKWKELDYNGNTMRDVELCIAIQGY